MTRRGRRVGYERPTILASLDLEREVATARAGVRPAVEAALAAGVRRFVLTSSVATIGPPTSTRKAIAYACATASWTLKLCTRSPATTPTRSSPSP